MISRMDEVYISGKMANAMKVSGRMASFMVKALRLYLMEQYLMEIGRRVDLSDRACASILTALSTQVAGSTVNLMVSESKFSQMVPSILEIGLMAKLTGWAKKLYRTELNMTVSGMTGNLKLESAVIRMENFTMVSGLMGNLMEKGSKLGQMEENMMASGI